MAYYSVSVILEFLECMHCSNYILAEKKEKWAGSNRGYFRYLDIKMSKSVWEYEKKWKFFISENSYQKDERIRKVQLTLWIEISVTDPSGGSRSPSLLQEQWLVKLSNHNEKILLTIFYQAPSDILSSS